MDDIATPEWIKRLKAESDLSEAQNEAARQRDRADMLAVRAEGPIFWQSLLKELQIAVDSLPLIGAQGSLSVIGRPAHSCAPPGPQQCRVSVRAKSILPRQTYTDIHYTNGDPAVRCYALEGGVFALEFSISPDGVVRVIADDDWKSPEQAAEFLIRKMLRIVGVKAV